MRVSLTRSALLLLGLAATGTASVGPIQQGFIGLPQLW